MTKHLTIRSPLATLASFSNTAFWAALLLAAAVGIRRVQDGSDVILVYSFPVIALVLVLLPLRVRVSLGSEGVTVQNLFIGHRTPWTEVDAVIVARLHVDVLWRLSFSVPGVVFRRRAGLDAEAYATWGLRNTRRRELVPDSRRDPERVPLRG